MRSSVTLVTAEDKQCGCWGSCEVRWEQTEREEAMKKLLGTD